MSYFAQMQRGNSLSHRTWLALNEKRHRMRLAWAEFFKDYDLLLCPVAVTAAFPHDQKDPRHERTIVVNNKRVPVVDQIFWAGYSCVTYLPASAAPIGQTATACRSACRSSARNMATTTASSSPSCWTRNIAGSCRHLPTKDKK